MTRLVTPITLALLSGILPACRATGVEPGLGPNPEASPASLGPAGPSYAQELSHAFQNISSTLGPAVVSVRSYASERRGWSRQQGSGVLVSEDGLIVTNNHVVTGASRFRISLTDGRDFNADLVGTDPDTDLAVLRIDAEDLSPAELEDGDRLGIGEWVLAMGNPLGLGHTVTLGVISGVGVSNLDIASYEDFIQTDASINRGNSGGPLVNLDGRVVGINTAIGTEEAGTVGIAYAIPVRMVRYVLDGLVSDGYVRRGWIGVEWGRFYGRAASAIGYTGRSRVVVRALSEGGPAEVGGLEPGDIVLGVAGRAVTTAGEVETMIAEAVPGSPLRMQVWREGGILELSLIPTERALK